MRKTSHKACQRYPMRCRIEAIIGTMFGKSIMENKFYKSAMIHPYLKFML